jgi:hypothetical protein
MESICKIRLSYLRKYQNMVATYIFVISVQSVLVTESTFAERISLVYWGCCYALLYRCVSKAFHVPNVDIHLHRNFRASKNFCKMYVRNNERVLLCKRYLWRGTVKFSR